MNKPSNTVYPIAILSGAVVLAVQQCLMNSSLGLNSVLIDGLLWVAGILATGAILRVVAPRLSRIGTLGFVLAWLFTAVGLVNITVVIIWLLSAWSTGALLLRWFSFRPEYPTASWTEAGLLGALAWLGIWGVMIHFPINRPGVYWELCLLPISLLPCLPAVMLTDIRKRAAALHAWIHAIPFWAWVVGLALIGWSLRWSSFPSMSYDDHAYHLRLWTDLLTRQRALFDLDDQIWSVAPFATDLLHAALSLMAGADARSALNLSLAVVLLALMARIMQRMGLAAWLQWLLMLLMASTPMLGNLLLSLQAELLLAVVGLAGLRLAIDADGRPRGKYALGVLACCALCAAIKLPGGVLGAALLASLGVRRWRWGTRTAQPSVHLRWHASLMFVPLAFVALHSYALAWWMAGNPVFPLYNAVFHSPLFSAENFTDSRWVHGFSLRSYWQVFFKTSEFFESGNYTAGWQYLILLPISVIALWRKDVPSALRLALLPLLGFGLTMFSFTQYWRYLFPVMPIAGVVLAAPFVGSSRTTRAVLLTLTLFCILLNFLFFPRVSWMMHSPAQAAYTNVDKERLTRLYAPAAVLTEEVNRIAPGSRVLYPSQAPYGATLHGSPLYVNWYAPARAARFAGLDDAQGMESFLREEQIDFAILSLTDAQTSTAPGELLREYMALYGSVQANMGPFVLYRLRDFPILYRKIFDLQSAIQSQSRETSLRLPIIDGGVEADAEPKALADFTTGRAEQARYSARLTCPSERGAFIAQINWDVGAPYYRLVACRVGEFSFVEAIPIPPGARQGMLYVTARDTTPILIKDLKVEVH